MKTMSANKEDDLSVDKNVNADVVDVDDLASKEWSIEKTPVPSIAKRLMSNSGKVVASVSELAKTTKKGKKSSTPLKPILYGPKKTWSKDVATTAGTSRKSIVGKKIPLNVPSTPMDNVSFHYETGASRWKYVYNRRLAIERNLSKDFLECQELVDLINEAGLMKTVWGLGKCYEKLVKEFLVNIGEDCDDPMSEEYMK
ncbi:envelope-like protein, partial [Trifolium medium]|nr:envelope-like protein [Trifolium medium]